MCALVCKLGRGAQLHTHATRTALHPLPSTQCRLMGRHAPRRLCSVRLSSRFEISARSYRISSTTMTTNDWHSDYAPPRARRIRPVTRHAFRAPVSFRSSLCWRSEREEFERQKVAPTSVNFPLSHSILIPSAQKKRRTTLLRPF